jgi:3-hydroxybutyryl-CoA dehydratase
MFTYKDLKVGDSNSFEKTITAADVLLFSAVSGDCNPMHINEEFAKNTQFGARIAHGALVASLISTALTNAFPTSIYISQTTKFVAPVYLGSTIKAVVTCKEKLGKGKVLMQTNCYDQTGKLVIEGEAVTRLARDPEEVPEKK